MKRLCNSVTSLDGLWQLYVVQNSRLQQDGYLNPEDRSLSTPALHTSAALRNAGYACIPAQVPGNFEWELYRAGKIEDPFYGTNIFRLQELEGTV